MENKLNELLTLAESVPNTQDKQALINNIRAKFLEGESKESTLPALLIDKTSSNRDKYWPLFEIIFTLDKDTLSAESKTKWGQILSHSFYESDALRKIRNSFERDWTIGRRIIGFLSNSSISLFKSITMDRNIIELEDIIATGFIQSLGISSATGSAEDKKNHMIAVAKAVYAAEKELPLERKGMIISAVVRMAFERNVPKGVYNDDMYDLFRKLFPLKEEKEYDERGNELPLDSEGLSPIWKLLKKEIYKDDDAEFFIKLKNLHEQMFNRISAVLQRAAENSSRHVANRIINAMEALNTTPTGNKNYKDFFKTTKTANGDSVAKQNEALDKIKKEQEEKNKKAEEDLKAIEKKEEKDLSDALAISMAAVSIKEAATKKEPEVSPASVVVKEDATTQEPQSKKLKSDAAINSNSSLEDVRNFLKQCLENRLNLGICSVLNNADVSRWQRIFELASDSGRSDIKETEDEKIDLKTVVLFLSQLDILKEIYNQGDHKAIVRLINSIFESKENMEAFRERQMLPTNLIPLLRLVGKESSEFLNEDARKAYDKIVYLDSHTVEGAVSLPKSQSTTAKKPLVLSAADISAIKKVLLDAVSVDTATPVANATTNSILDKMVVKYTDILLSRFEDYKERCERGDKEGALDTINLIFEIGIDQRITNVRARRALEELLLMFGPQASLNKAAASARATVGILKKSFISRLRSNQDMEMLNNLDVVIKTAKTEQDNSWTHAIDVDNHVLVERSQFSSKPQHNQSHFSSQTDNAVPMKLEISATPTASATSASASKSNESNPIHDVLKLYLDDEATLEDVVSAFKTADVKTIKRLFLGSTKLMNEIADNPEGIDLTASIIGTLRNRGITGKLHVGETRDVFKAFMALAQAHNSDLVPGSDSQSITSSWVRSSSRSIVSRQSSARSIVSRQDRYSTFTDQNDIAVLSEFDDEEMNPDNRGSDNFNLDANPTELQARRQKHN